MIKCIILEQEISEEECKQVTIEAYKEKPKVVKKFKRIISWKFICKECPNHKQK